jgi:S-adenosylmethionine decarboxylase
MEDDDGKVVHDHLFDPCGYSMNGVAREDRYWTIHITPEAHCSYVSFETNFAPESYDSLVSKVMRTFKPQRATVVIQADKMSPLLSGASSLSLAAGTVDGFSVTGQSITQLVDEYTVQLVNYEAVDSSTDDGTWTMSSQSSIDSDRS